MCVVCVQRKADSQRALADYSGGDEEERAQLEMNVQRAEDYLQSNKQEALQTEVDIATTAAAILPQGNSPQGHEYHYSTAS